MRLKLNIVVLIVCTLMGCQKINEYSLSEQMVNHYLHTEKARSINYFHHDERLKINFSLTDLSVLIGRDINGDIAGQCKAKAILQLPERKKDINIVIKLSGIPQLDSHHGAIYLDSVLINQYKTDDENDHDIKKLIAHLKPLMQTYFTTYPIYLVDESCQIEKEVLTTTSRLSVEKGQLVFLL